MPRRCIAWFALMVSSSGCSSVADAGADTVDSGASTSDGSSDAPSSDGATTDSATTDSASADSVSTDSVATDSVAADTGVDAFAKYCTGTLLIEQKYMKGMGAGWSSGADQISPVGTKFFVSNEYSGYGGYFFLSDGGPAKFESNKLVVGTDFSCDCATHDDKKDRFVFLQTVTLFPNKDLTGTPCTIAAGTGFEMHSWVGGLPATFQSDELTPICGFGTGYANGMSFGNLIMK